MGVKMGFIHAPSLKNFSKTDKVSVINVIISWLVILLNQMRQHEILNVFNT